MATNNSNNNTSYGLTINTSGSPASFTTQGIYNNLNQPYFKAFVSGSIPTVTGNGTVYTVVFESVEADNYNEYNPATGEWVPTHAGIYLISYSVSLSDITSLNTFATLTLTNTGAPTGYDSYYNPAAVSSPVFFPAGGTITFSNSVLEIIDPSGFVLTVTIVVVGEVTNNVGILGSTGGPLLTYFSAIKIA